MNSKILISGTLLLVLTLMVSFFFLGQKKDRVISSAKSEYINFQNNTGNNKKSEPGKRDHIQLKKENKSKDKEAYSLSRYFNEIKESGIDLKALFYDIEDKFKNSFNTGSHLAEVYDFLLEKYGKEKAEIVYKVYSQYIKCRENLASKLQSLSYPKNKDEILERIDFVIDFRKDFLGEEIYDVLYRDSSNRKKYVVEKNTLIHDDSLYSYEKLEQLKELDKKYGDEYSTASMTGYERYRESLLIHEKDLSELSSDDLLAKKEELRQAYFSSETLEKREQLAKKDKVYDNKVALYVTKKEEIELNSDLSDEEKKELIEETGLLIFSEDEKDRYDRAIALTKGRNKLLKKYGLDKEK